MLYKRAYAMLHAALRHADMRRYAVTALLCYMLCCAMLISCAIDAMRALLSCLRRAHADTALVIRLLSVPLADITVMLPDVFLLPFSPATLACCLRIFAYADALLMLLPCCYALLC